MGILEFVFGKGTPKDDTAPKQAFYLNDDDAKTFGNINYMRSAKTVRRTFAKKKGQEHLERVRQISSTAAKNFGENSNSLGSSQTAATFGDYNTSTSVPQKESASSNAGAYQPARRKPASGDMDMFRNMAKDIRK